jgi:hypothetical protein
MACHSAACLTWVTAALIAVAALAFSTSGCGTGSSVSDSKISTALELKRAGGGYEMGGDPFCAIDRLLNDAGEVEEASDQRGDSFVIASPNGEVGVLARRPFAPDCARRARSALKRLARQSSD